MPHEAGMLDTACKCDLIVNGRVNNQSSTASLITHEHYPDCSAWLPLPHAPSGTGQPTETDTAVLPAISIFIQLLIPDVYQSSFQVKPLIPLQHNHWCHPNLTGLKMTCLKQEVEGSTLDIAECH